MYKTKMQRDIEFVEKKMKHYDLDTWIRYEGRERKVHSMHYTGHNTFAIELNDVCILGCTKDQKYTYCHPENTMLRCYYPEYDLITLDPDNMPA